MSAPEAVTNSGDIEKSCKLRADRYDFAGSRRDALRMQMTVVSSAKPTSEWADE